ncbi:uncharacterized protein LOC108136832 isoform X1 [Drosophila elegans]|uniref:uncharacterized protein LOC108136832 isoform X1 n=1 Tax=Drosophila elegans TaxID=30023 RepID=UPI0007E86CC3|nr:uncharacterized protein LOC108136832 isoform X1 [Drosophila elegans]
MAYSGVRLPGIFCPDESVEQFVKLYGNDNFSHMIMALTVSPPYDRPINVHSTPAHPPPSMMEVNPFRLNGSPPPVDERNLKFNPRYGEQIRPASNGGFGDHYSHLSSFINFKPAIHVRHARPVIQDQREKQYHSEQYQHMNYMYPLPPGPRFPWL